MHVCLICVEIFAWGKYGGFGRATRLIGRELVKRGIKVTAIVPRRSNQAKVEMLDGIRVLGFDLNDVPGMLKIYRDCDADIYHSQEPSLGTYLAKKFHPEKKHLVTFRDTRLLSDWLTEIRLPSLNSLQVLLNWAYEDGFLVHHAVRNADGCFVSANFLAERAMHKYKLKASPQFLPTPVVIPAKIEKDATPTVCYIARWDRRKRPELMLEVARLHPNVHFIMAGLSRDRHYDHEIRSRFSELPNVELNGFINQFESDRLSNILSRSWVLINTASREGLPNSFLEACAHHCALLSSVDPDGFSSSFGYYAQDQHLSTGLDYLLENNRWKELGEKGFEYISQTFALETALQQHLAIYEASKA
jgi:glycosyltransferase involved in cell wall biosynthesis